MRRWISHGKKSYRNIIHLLILTVCTHSFIYFPVSAQVRPTPEAIRFLLQQKHEIPVIHGWASNLIPESSLPMELKKQFQYLIKNRNGLFCGINGTGMLFRIEDSAGNMTVKRIDSTFYLGDNFWSSNFSYRNKIYSFGGYGFWQHNGLLRQFNTASHDWSVIPINEEHATSSSFHFWLDTVEGKLFLKPERHIEAFIQNKQQPLKDTSQLWMLTLQKGTWEKLGTIAFPLNSYAHASWGLLDFGPYWACLYDFKKLKRYKGTRNLWSKLAKPIANLEKNLFFVIDSTMYYTDPLLSRLDSIQLSITDFESNGQSLLTETDGTSGVSAKQLLGWSAPIFLLLGLFYYRQQRKKEKKHHPYVNKQQEVPIPTSLTIPATVQWEKIFTSLEKSLIRLILENYGKNEPTQAEDLNYLLGLSDKKESIQKKNRNDIINSINQKWQAIEKGSGQLIIRERAVHDKRIFLYSIQAEQIAKARSLLS